MYGPLLTSLLGLKELTHGLIESASIEDNTGTVRVDREQLSALIAQLDVIARHAAAESQWRTSSAGQTSAVFVASPLYGPKRRAFE